MKTWEAIAPHSVYVGFDPDRREIHEEQYGGFFKKWIVNEAVTAGGNGEAIPFYLTASPYCSSTLRPDIDSLSDYLFSDLFAVAQETQVRASSLDSVLGRLSLPGIDWLKLDTQGTDLRVFNSLREDIRAGVLALDIEPGLIDAYVGEDLFAEAHGVLSRSGFWLSNLKLGSDVRMRRSTVEAVRAFDPVIGDTAFLEGVAKKSPVYCEARYLRTLSWLLEDRSPRDYVLLWVFALMDDQVGFALDIAREYELGFGKDDTTAVLWREPLARLREVRALRLKRARVKRVARALLVPLMPRRVRQWLKGMLTV